MFQIIPHVVCSNCGFPHADFDSLCPACKAPIDYHGKPRIVHIPVELEKMEKVRQYLVANGVIDDDSFVEFINEDQQ